jgi:hypothetical protein
MRSRAFARPTCEKWMLMPPMSSVKTTGHAEVKVSRWRMAASIVAMIAIQSTPITARRCGSSWPRKLAA